MSSRRHRSNVGKLATVYRVDMPFLNTVGFLVVATGKVAACRRIELILKSYHHRFRNLGRDVNRGGTNLRVTAEITRG